MIAGIDRYPCGSSDVAADSLVMIVRRIRAIINKFEKKNKKGLLLRSDRFCAVQTKPELCYLTKIDSFLVVRGTVTYLVPLYQ